MMKTELEGEALVVGDNIDTDMICPGRYLELTDPKEIGSHCLGGLDEKIAVNFPKGGFVVAGKNFGCGSSREHAAIALKEMGASAVIAKSFARIFYRNAINLGLPLIVCPRAADEIQNGQRLHVDLSSGLITNMTTGKTLKAEPFSEKALEILSAGGIIQLMKKKHCKA